MDDLYLELTERNRGFITLEEQRKIRRCMIAVMGCGLGSVVAELAVRTGFHHVLIADNGEVERSNLNRQAYTEHGIGKSKVRALRQHLIAINPDIRLGVYPHKLTADDLPEILAKADLVVDAIGIEALPLAVELHQQARAQREDKMVIEPMNFGPGGGVVVFGSESTTFEETIGLQPGDDLQALTDNPAQMLPYWAHLAEQYLPEYLRGSFQKFLRGVQDRGWCAIPQLGIGTYLTAAITVGVLVQLALGKSVRMAPEFISFDPWGAALMPTRYEG